MNADVCPLFISTSRADIHRNAVVWLLDLNCLDAARDLARMHRGFLYLRLDPIDGETEAWTFSREPRAGTR